MPKAQATRHYEFDQPLATGETHRRRHGAHLQPGQRPGVRARQPASSAARSCRRWSRAPSTCTRRFATRTACPTTTRRRIDFNFASIYTENAFGGHDRIADNNLLTLGATTRLLDPDTGAEAGQVRIAQRLRFKDQLVTLPGQPAGERAPVGRAVRRLGQLVPQWSAEGTVQYNPETRPVDPLDRRRALQPGQLPRWSAAAYRRQQGLQANRSTSAGSGRSTTCGATRARTWAPAWARAKAAGTAWAA